MAIESARDKARKGVGLIWEATVELLAHHPEGLSHAEIARKLDIEFSYHGGSNYVSQTLLHQLVYQDQVRKTGEGARARFSLAGPPQKKFLISN